ncbi:MAG: choice-of-anchor V domain-containing protein, partial [Candidatus Thermoplasmatota archaeon]|nr:choice-of-anchor V domain-containing protein [Candidatus Thermoplasmatota archaeon]
MKMGEKGSRHIALVLLLLLVLAVPQEAFANSTGKTGRSDSGCGGTACHSNTGTVTPELSGLPASGYSGGAVYTLTIGGSGGPSGTNGGFNLDASHGAFSNPGSNAKIQNDEVTHSNSNSRSWTVDWTAPSSGSGDVTFYLAVNFVNGNGGNTGDAWGYSSWTSSQSTTSTNSSLNQAGSERGSVFSNSVFELNSGSPTLVLDNGTRVTFASANNSSSPVYTSDDVVSIAGSCAILDNYSLRCTGVNNYGQLGIGSFALSNGTVDLGNRMAAAISDGNSHNCAILDDGSVSCWGRNNVGQLGDGSNANRNSPVSVDLGTNTTAVALSSGIDSTCALTNTGAIKCWGGNFYGVLGDGTTTHSNVPVEVNHSTGMRAVAIATPGYGACAIFENGSVYCWGQSYTVTAMFGTVTNGSVHIDFAAGRTAVAIDGTSDHMCAIMDNGSMNCWGVNTYG